MSRRKPKSNKGKGRGKGTLLLVILVLLAGAVGAGWWIATPYGPENETFVELPPGSSTAHIGRVLEESGIVRSRYAFDLFRWLRRGRLKAGEYRFDHPASVWEVYARIARGDVYTRTVVVPEGANVFEIAARLQKAGLKAGDGFVEEQAHLTRLVADLDPDAKSLEGYLFPDTYRFQRAATAEQVCAAMVRRFRAAAAEIGLKQNVHQVVTIASLVERETAIDAERPLVASVFENRLAKNMPLMTDPAVIYGLELEGRWRGAIYQSDLKRNTPYNTYLHAGLPPGPVSNPGLRSLKAAMNPAQTNYLYFVAAGANPQGKSLFASSLAEHTRNVSGYRHATKKAGGS
jgi:peptidoglycan lytic transglycosylase G